MLWKGSILFLFLFLGVLFFTSMCGTDTIKDCFANQIFLAILILQVLCIQVFWFVFFFLDSILEVLHLTFSSSYDASNSLELLMVVQKEATAKQSKSSSLSVNNWGAARLITVLTDMEMHTVDYVSENHCPCKVLSLFWPVGGH